MRVLLVHEYYRERGGEDVAFETDEQLLTNAGHNVDHLVFNNAEIDEKGAASKLGLFATTVWSRKSADRVTNTIERVHPDVVHFHNTFPLVSPAAVRAAAHSGAATVLTLHNYRLVCSNASLFREGHACEKCLKLPAPLPGVLYGCYRGSRSQSLAVASMLLLHRVGGTWNRVVDRFIAPSQFLRAKLIEGGLPASRISVRPNAVTTPKTAPRTDDGSFLYAGRLTENKGIDTMLTAWRDATMPQLRIAGAGEYRNANGSRSAKNIQWLGAVSHDDVLAVMQQVRALVFPSIWYENQPLTILEAFASGLPVIASDIGAIPELVRDNVTGLLFPAGDAAALAAKVRWAAANPEAMRLMGDAARAVYEYEYGPSHSLTRLVEIYEDAVDSARSRGRTAATVS